VSHFKPLSLQPLNAIKDKFVYESARTMLLALNQLLNTFTKEYEVVTPSAANTDFPILHNTGRTIQSWSVVHKSAAADIYLSPATMPTNTTLTLRSTVGSVTVRLLLF